MIYAIISMIDACFTVWDLIFGGDDESSCH